MPTSGNDNIDETDAVAVVFDSMYVRRIEIRPIDVAWRECVVQPTGRLQTRIYQGCVVASQRQTNVMVEMLRPITDLDDLHRTAI
jgi:hypothetical protein